MTDEKKSGVEGSNAKIPDSEIQGTKAGKGFHDRQKGKDQREGEGASAGQPAAHPKKS